MADWPTVAAVKSALGVDSDTSDEAIAAALAASIEQVGFDLGYQEVTVELESGEETYLLTGTLDPDVDATEVIPNASISQAALILAVMTMKAPDAPFGVAAVFDTGGLRVAAQHPTYQRMLVGNRQAFGLA